MISARHIKAWEKFNEDLNAFRAETGEDYATLYENANIVREVKDFHMTQSGELTFEEYETYAISANPITHEREQMIDEDDAREYLKYWRDCLRRAKRYWTMDTERLDAIQDGQIEDDEQ